MKTYKVVVQLKEGTAHSTIIKEVVFEAPIKHLETDKCQDAINRAGVGYSWMSRYSYNHARPMMVGGFYERETNTRNISVFTNPYLDGTKISRQIACPLSTEEISEYKETYSNSLIAALSRQRGVNRIS